VPHVSSTENDVTAPELANCPIPCGDLEITLKRNRQHAAWDRMWCIAAPLRGGTHQGTFFNIHKRGRVQGLRWRCRETRDQFDLHVLEVGHSLFVGK
jgi:hypothetical protein